MRVLTNQEKEELRQNPNFKEECKWAILNKAAYWRGLDGSAVPGDDRLKWAKCRSYGTQVILNPSMADAVNNLNISDRFLNYFKNVTCVDDQVAFNADAIVTYLLDNNHFEAQADSWFNDQVILIAF